MSSILLDGIVEVRGYAYGILGEVYLFVSDDPGDQVPFEGKGGLEVHGEDGQEVE